MTLIKIFFNILKERTMTPLQRAESIKNKPGGVHMGDHCEVFSNVSFGSEPYLVTLGNNVKITSAVQFITHDGGMYVLRNMKLLENADKFGRINVGNNVFIGVCSTIMPGVTIGDNVVIGACSVVTHDIPSNSVACGVPARVIKSIEQYYENSKDKVDFVKSMNRDEKKMYLFRKYNINLI